MELSNTFRVGVAAADAWKVLTDVERIAPHLPGAQLQEIDGDEYRGVVKVKVGPVTVQYKGTASFVERDEAAGRVVLRCRERDTAGQGNANATITPTLAPEGDGTTVVVTTELAVTGRVAQYGRGVMAEVSEKLIGRFVDALEADLRDNGVAPAADVPVAAAGTPAAGPQDTAAGGGGAGDPPAGETDAGGRYGAVAGNGALHDHDHDSDSAPGGPPVAPPAGPRRVASTDPEAVDLLAAAGPSLLKRLVPVAGGAALVAAGIVLLRRRRR